MLSGGKEELLSIGVELEGVNKVQRHCKDELCLRLAFGSSQICTSKESLQRFIQTKVLWSAMNDRDKVIQ